MHRWLNTLLLVVGLWIGLACGLDSDDRMVRRYAVCLTDTNTALYRMAVSSASGTVTLRAEAMEERLRGQLERESSPWGRSGPTTPATVNRSWRELRKERGRKAHGRGAVRYQNGPRKAECQVRYGGDGMRRVWRGLDGWSDDLGRMMWRFRNQGGSKRGDENRHRVGGQNPRTNRFT